MDPYDNMGQQQIFQQDNQQQMMPMSFENNDMQNVQMMQGVCMGQGGPKGNEAFFQNNGNQQPQICMECER